MFKFNLLLGPLEVSDVHAQGCKVKWEKPEDDGGSPIKEYELEKMDLATGKWVRVGRQVLHLLFVYVKFIFQVANFD